MMTEEEKYRLGTSDISEIWTPFRIAEHKLLALDYDGTLAPFNVERMEARPVPGIIDALQSINEDQATIIYIISGRPADEVAFLLDWLPVPIIGSHGYDRLDPGGEIKVIDPGSDVKALLASAAELARRKFDLKNIECKTASVALHTRGYPDSRADAMQAEISQLWAPFTQHGSVELTEFNGGVELRAIGRDKGSVVADITRHMPEDAFIVYIGDDRTDEDAFRVVKPIGYGIKVGVDSLPTEAGYILRDCDETLEFLKTWVEISKRGKRFK